MCSDHSYRGRAKSVRHRACYDAWLMHYSCIFDQASMNQRSGIACAPDFSAFRIRALIYSYTNSILFLARSEASLFSGQSRQPDRQPHDTPCETFRSDQAQRAKSQLSLAKEPRDTLRRSGADRRSIGLEPLWRATVWTLEHERLLSSDPTPSPL
jgi:hypothetical protein